MKFVLDAKLFNEFKISGMGGEISTLSLRSSMLEQLIVYLILHRDANVTAAELMDALWMDDEISNPAGALKNLIYRLRAVVKNAWKDAEHPDFIVSGSGYYRWNPAINMHVDVEDFLGDINQADSETDLSIKKQYLRKALDAYPGKFMSDKQSVYWVMTEAAFLHNQYIKAVKDLCALLELEKDWEGISQIADNALRIDDTEEDFYYIYMDSLVHQKKYVQASHVYDNAVTILYDKMGITQPERLLQLQELMHRESHIHDKSIDMIEADLMEQDECGAFFCEYGIFRKIYRLQRRRILREKKPSDVLLISLSLNCMKKVSESREGSLIDYGMELLQRVLLRSLRTGDVVAKYGRNRYIIMLENCNEQNGKKTMTRVLGNMWDVNKGKQFGLKYEMKLIK